MPVNDFVLFKKVNNQTFYLKMIVGKSLKYTKDINKALALNFKDTADFYANKHNLEITTKEEVQNG